MAKPIFVVGRNRSGTKWLSNIISSSSRVACVQHPEHYGILEATDIIHTLPMLFGDLKITENYISYLDCVSGTDFFRLAGGKTDTLLKSESKSQYVVFRKLMDDFAEREGKDYWLQKIGPNILCKLFHEFQDAYFIFIAREMISNIKSVIGLEMKELQGTHFRKRLVGHALHYYTDLSILNKYRHHDNVLFVSYEGLLKHTEETLERICQKLQFTQNQMIETRVFRKNTSFKTVTERDHIISTREMYFMALLALLLRNLPNIFYTGLGRFYRWRRRAKFFSVRQRKVLSLKLRKKEIEII